MINKTLLEISNNFKKLTKQSNNIEKAANLIIDTIKTNNKIMFCGNGGSAADSQHLSAELIGRYRINRDPLPAVALTTDTSTITAIANDFSFEEIFSRQIRSIGVEGDVLYAVSTSGNSKNIIEAIKVSAEMGLKIIGLTGIDGGKMNGLCSELIKVPAETPDRIQELHIAVGQIICDLVEKKFFS